MSFISLDINLNHIFFLLISITCIIRQILLEIYYSDLENENPASIKLFETYLFTISNYFSVFCICISKKRTQSQKANSIQKIEKKDNMDIKLIYTDIILPISKCRILIRTLLVSISDLIAQFSSFLLYFFYDIQKQIKQKIYSLLIFSIFFNYIFSRVMLKTYLYNHHYLSIIINLICLLIMGSFDIINMINDDTEIMDNIIFLGAKIFTSICYAFENVIGKKALIEEFLSPYTILMYRGIYETTLLIILSIPFIFIKDDSENIIFESFINRINTFKKIILFIFIMIFNFLYNVFIWIINDKFSPNHIAMAMIIDTISKNLIKYKDIQNAPFYSITEIVILAILIIGNMIYNEIAIINCCGLNKYTRNKLVQKGEEDYQIANLSQNQDDSNIIDSENDESLNENSHYISESDSEF